MKPSSYARRYPPISKLNWLRKCAFQLDFFAEIDDNGGQTGTPVLVAPTPPNHNGGIGSIMVYTNSTPTPQAPQVRPTYAQDWPSYNLAQQNEKERFLVLLRDLCSTVSQPPQTRGRPRLPLSDMLFAATYKVYAGFSARRFTSDVQSAMQDGLIDHAPHFNSTNRYLADPALTPLLKSLIREAAAPLSVVESDFAADSTGFATSTYARWFDHKWGKERTRQTWVKTHLMVGVKTHVVTAVEATPTESSDNVQFPSLVAQTARQFSVNEISADKAYSSRRSHQAVQEVGGTAYIPFRKDATGTPRKQRFDGLWYRAWHLYNFNR